MLSNRLEHGLVRDLSLAPTIPVTLPVVKLGTAPTIQAVACVVPSRVDALSSLTLLHGPRAPTNPLVMGPNLVPSLGRCVVMATRLTLGTT